MQTLALKVCSGGFVERSEVKKIEKQIRPVNFQMCK